MPSMRFTPTWRFPWRRGRLYLGRSPILRRTVGVKTERHAITIAGAGAGKGSCTVIPNLLRWPHNVLSIDPKGEAIEATWKARKRLKRPACALDPFHGANIPADLRAAFNPLDMVDPRARTAREAVMVIADGLVKRSDPKHAAWDDTTVEIIAGLTLFVAEKAPLEHRSLMGVRRVLTQSRADLEQDVARLFAMGGAAAAAGQIIQTALSDDQSLEKQALSQARRHTAWLDNPAMRDVLGHSTFKLSELRSGRISVFLVLPPAYLESNAGFLRLFVRCAIAAMAGGSAQKREQQCLFILDEFYSLGRINEIAVAAGLMRGYGLQIWPILQDLGQLTSLYGSDSDTFFGNADLHQFFGNTDQTTLEYISRAIGTRHVPGLFGGDQEHVGQPLMSPLEIRQHVAKRQHDKVARRSINFAQGQAILSVRPTPYFKD